MAIKQNRRSAIKSMLAGTAAIGASATLSSFAFAAGNESSDAGQLKGNINHSVCRWCYADIPLEQLCAASKNIGIRAIDLVGPKEWPVLQQYGLYSAMCNGAE